MTYEQPYLISGAVIYFFVYNVIFERFLLLAFCYFHLFKTVHFFLFCGLTQRTFLILDFNLFRLVNEITSSRRMEKMKNPSNQLKWQLLVNRPLGMINQQTPRIVFEWGTQYFYNKIWLMSYPNFACPKSKFARNSKKCSLKKFSKFKNISNLILQLEYSRRLKKTKKCWSQIKWQLSGNRPRGMINLRTPRIVFELGALF